MLVWFKKIQSVDVDHIRGSIPKDNTFFSILSKMYYAHFMHMSISLYEVKQILVSYVAKLKSFI